MQTVYIETSVLSYLTSRPSRDLLVAAHQQVTVDWWENRLPLLEPFISPIVIEEVSRGDEIAAKQRLEKIVGFPNPSSVPPKNLWRSNMKTDPIVEQVRQVRKQIEKENQQDPEFFYQYLKRIQERFSDRLVCREPKPLGIRRKKKVA